VAKKRKCCCLFRANILLFVAVLLGVVSAAVDANWTQRFLSPESFMTTVFPLASVLLILGVIVLSELKSSCDIMLGKGAGN
jgi:protein-S-isoprenylcysteine O-methyltransferase Ste14